MQRKGHLKEYGNLKISPLLFSKIGEDLAEFGGAVRAADHDQRAVAPFLKSHHGKGANGSKNRPHDGVASPLNTNYAAKGSV